MLPEFELCCDEFSRFGLSLDRGLYEKLDIYADFLVSYNENVNLTAITEPGEILKKHFIDSILLLQYAEIPENSSIIDVGTGAGFPSVPVKLYRPDIKITVLDSLNKRVTFLRELCGRLYIEAEFIHGRAEDISKMPEYREKFDFSCARAVAGMPLLSELCIPFVRVGGAFLAMKGPNEDISLGENAVSILGGEITKIHEYELYDEHRRIAEVRKISHTPPKYPRNSSQIKKKSL